MHCLIAHPFGAAAWVLLFFKVSCRFSVISLYLKSSSLTSTFSHRALHVWLWSGGWPRQWKTCCSGRGRWHVVSWPVGGKHGKLGALRICEPQPLRCWTIWAFKQRISFAAWATFWYFLLYWLYCLVKNVISGDISWHWSRMNAHDCKLIWAWSLPYHYHYKCNNTVYFNIYNIVQWRQVKLGVQNCYIVECCPHKSCSMSVLTFIWSMYSTSFLAALRIDPKNPGCLLLSLRKLDVGTLQRLGRLWCLWEGQSLAGICKMPSVEWSPTGTQLPVAQ